MKTKMKWKTWNEIKIKWNENEKLEMKMKLKTWNEMKNLKRNEMKLNEMKWKTWNEIKWNEMKMKTWNENEFDYLQKYYFIKLLIKQSKMKQNIKFC